MRTVVSIATLALATTMFATPAFADDAPAAPAGGAAAAAAPAAPAAPAAAADGEDDGKKIGLGGDLLFTLPIGDMADGTGPLIGLSIRAGYYVMPAFEAYLRAGYQMGLKKEQGAIAGNTLSTGINNIPIMLGGRYFFMQPYAGLYGNLEIGMNMLTPTAEAGGTSASGDSLTRFGANIGAGYVISKDLPINIGAQLSLLNLLGTESGEKTLMGINVLAGYEARF
jgi:Outer membrane protein beta-barrel domain